MNHYCYFRSQLSSADGAAYDKIKEAISNYQTSAVISTLPPKGFNLIYSKVLNENPLLFYASGFEYHTDGKSAEFFPKYNYPKIEKENLIKLCKQSVETICQQATKLNESEKVLFVHNEIVRNFRYGNKYEGDSQTIVGPLIKGIGTCKGFSMLVKLFFDYLGVESIVVCGDAKEAATDKIEPHAWNIVKVGGFWFHMDVTFDTTLRNGNLMRYDYYKLSDEQIKNDHFYDESEYPSCWISTEDYFTKNKLVMHDVEQFSSYFIKCMKDNKQEIAVKLPDTMIGLDTGQKVMDICMKCLEKERTSGAVNISFNKNRQVFHITLNLNR